MTHDDLQHLNNLFTQVHGVDARAFSLLFAMSRLCFLLREKGVLLDGDIEKAFDPVRAAQSVPESFRAKVSENIQDLRNYSLGNAPARH